MFLSFTLHTKLHLKGVQSLLFNVNFKRGEKNFEDPTFPCQPELSFLKMAFIFYSNTSTYKVINWAFIFSCFIIINGLLRHTKTFFYPFLESVSSPSAVNLKSDSSMSLTPPPPNLTPMICKYLYLMCELNFLMPNTTLQHLI